MRIKAANKRARFSRKEKRGEKRSVQEIARQESIDAQPADMFELEILTNTGANFDYSDLDLTITVLTKELMRAGYSTIEIVSESSKTINKEKKLSRKNVIQRFKNKKAPSDEHVIKRIDLKKYISKKKIQNLRLPENLEDEDDNRHESIYKFVRSAKRASDLGGRKDPMENFLSTQDDKQGILEIRLGKNKEQFTSQATMDMSSRNSLFDHKNVAAHQRNTSTVQSVSRSRSRGSSLLSGASSKSSENKEIYTRKEPVNPLIRLLKGPKSSMANKRAPSCAKIQRFSKSIKTPQRPISTGKSSRHRRMPKPIQAPIIKSVVKIPVRQVDVIPVSIRFPSPGTRVFVRAVGQKNKPPVIKTLPIKPLSRLALKTTYPFLDDKYLPKINASPLGNSQVLIRVTNIDPKVDNVSIFRREISTRPLEDEYELILEQSPESDEFVFFDTVGAARAYKYVCVSDGLPVYTYAIFVDKSFTYEKFDEPKLFAYQNGTNVIIETSSIPSHSKKVLFYRKSSIEDEELLIDGVSLLGQQSSRRNLRIIDEPSPIEQVITYRLETVDEDGITSSYDEKPEVIYTSDIGITRANITQFRAKYNQVTDEVDLVGECYVQNMFISKNDASLGNPDSDILKAAARRQLLVKIQIRRIDNKSGEDEIILKEIINPGLSKFNTELRALNRIKFSFSDSGENSATFGYTPLFPYRKYTYIARIIVYPIGLELRKVPDFKVLNGEADPGRLKYTYDPGVFDHPLNTEIGILPATGNSSKDYRIADNIGQTTRALIQRVAVKESDIADSVSLKSKVFIDNRFDPVVRIDIGVPTGLLDDLDHVQLHMSYDTVSGEDIIDRLFIRDPETTYYDYSFDDLAANTVTYTIKGVGKDLRPIFTSSETKISLKNDIIKKANLRKKSLRRSIHDKDRDLKIARRNTRRRLKKKTQG